MRRPGERLRRLNEGGAHFILPLIADTLGEMVADGLPYYSPSHSAGELDLHDEDERSPKHSKRVNGLIPIGDMQCRIDVAVPERRDVGADLVIIARRGEMYTSAMGGGGTEEAIRRGLTHAEAGAIVFVPRPDLIPELAKAMKIPVFTLGFNIPGTAFTLSTGWSWATAATSHLEVAEALMPVASANYAPPEKCALLEQPLLDDLIQSWTDETGRESRPDHAR